MFHPLGNQIIHNLNDLWVSSIKEVRKLVGKQDLAIRWSLEQTSSRYYNHIRHDIKSNFELRIDLEFQMWKSVNLLLPWPPKRIPKKKINGQLEWEEFKGDYCWPSPSFSIKQGWIWVPYVGLIEVFTWKRNAQTKARHLHPNPYFQVPKNANIVALKVMTLTIVIHCNQNFILASLLTTRMVKANEDMKEVIVFNLKIKLQVMLAKVVALPFITPICVQIHFIVFH